MKEPPKRILWSVNPFAEDQRLIKRMAVALALLSEQWGAEIEPVYVLADVPPNVRLLPLLVQDVQQQARDELRLLLPSRRPARLRELRLLVSASSQLRDQVGVLLHYARERQATVIAVSTRARRGPQRWIMGSFTETLIHESPVPLYVINPAEHTPRPINQIFFPTDFSEQSHRAYVQVIRAAREGRGRITLFHKVSNAYSPMYEIGYGGYAAYAAYYEELVNDKRAKANEWAAEAAALGVKVRVIIDHQTDRSTAEAIVLRASRHGGIIAMSGHTGNRVGLLGGITRQVVRTAPLPVWVLQPGMEPAQTQTPPLRERRGS